MTVIVSCSHDEVTAKNHIVMRAGRDRRPIFTDMATLIKLGARK